MFVTMAGLLFDNPVFVDTRFILRIDKIYPVIVNGKRALGRTQDLADIEKLEEI